MMVKIINLTPQCGIGITRLPPAIPVQQLPHLRNIAMRIGNPTFVISYRKFTNCRRILIEGEAIRVHTRTSSIANFQVFKGAAGPQTFLHFRAYSSTQRFSEMAKRKISSDVASGLTPPQTPIEGPSKQNAWTHTAASFDFRSAFPQPVLHSHPILNKVKTQATQLQHPRPPCSQQ
jgi:hypothetical protein